MLAILCHVLRGEPLLRERLAKEREGARTDDEPGPDEPGARRDPHVNPQQLQQVTRGAGGPGHLGFVWGGSIPRKEWVSRYQALPARFLFSHGGGGWVFSDEGTGAGMLRFCPRGVGGAQPAGNDDAWLIFTSSTMAGSGERGCLRKWGLVSMVMVCPNINIVGRGSGCQIPIVFGEVTCYLGCLPVGWIPKFFPCE